MAQMIAVQNNYSKREEFWNAVTHGIGAFISIPATILLVGKNSDTSSFIETFSYIIFGITMFSLYLASTLYHSIPVHKSLLKKLDHSSIFLLIAGTYTPIALIAIGGKLGWILFSIEWGLAFLGILFKMFFVHRFPKLSLIVYIGMGWLAVFVYEPLVNEISFNGIFLLLAGGLCYTIGTYFYKNKKIPFNHAIWHVFVMGGSLFMYLTIYLFV